MRLHGILNEYSMIEIDRKLSFKSLGEKNKSTSARMFICGIHLNVVIHSGCLWMMGFFLGCVWWWFLMVFLNLVFLFSVLRIFRVHFLENHLDIFGWLTMNLPVIRLSLSISVQGHMGLTFLILLLDSSLLFSLTYSFYYQFCLGSFCFLRFVSFCFSFFLHHLANVWMWWYVFWNFEGLVMIDARLGAGWAARRAGITALRPGILGNNLYASSVGSSPRMHQKQQRQQRQRQWTPISSFFFLLIKCTILKGAVSGFRFRSTSTFTFRLANS